jgi:hypothetical protein
LSIFPKSLRIVGWVSFYQPSVAGFKWKGQAFLFLRLVKEQISSGQVFDYYCKADPSTKRLVLDWSFVLHKRFNLAL